MFGQTAHLFAGDHNRIVRAGEPDLAGDRLGGVGMIAGDHDHPDSRLAAPGRCFRHLRPGRIFQANEPGEDQILFQAVAVPLRLQQAVGKREDTQALLGHGFLGCENLLAQPGVEWTRVTVRRIRLHRGRTDSSAPLQ